MDMKDTHLFDELDIVLDSTIEGILLLENGFIVNANKSFVKTLGYTSKKSLIGNLATGCLIPPISEKYLMYNNNSFQEIFLLTKEAKKIPAILKTKDVVIKDKPFKMVSILDLSDLRKNETLLLRQSRHAAMGEMIHMISHQWRQPLTAISAIILNLKMKISTKKLNMTFCESKLNEVNNYLQVTSKTVDVFKNFFNNDKSKRFFYLQELVQLSVDMIQVSLEENHIKITIENKDLSKLYVYENELMQVVMNIINNARDALLAQNIKNPQINISFEENESTQIILIEDNAKGIEENILSQIFDPYFSTKETLEGTGLGLYMSKMIIQKYCEGDIFVHNTQNGCCFKIIISKLL